jgi:hypothetical protein
VRQPDQAPPGDQKQGGDGDNRNQDDHGHPRDMAQNCDKSKN